MLDVPGMVRLREQLEPHLPRLSSADALCAMHMARVDMRYISRKLKAYSIEWLQERGIEKVNGQWRKGEPPSVIAEAVGIASKSNVPGLSNKIVTAMTDALQNSIAKGVIEPDMQREVMQKARGKVRFKGRYV